MGQLIIDIVTISALCIGLCFSLFPILRFQQNNNIIGRYGVVVFIFMPLLYTLLSFSRITLGSVYLYYLLAILVYIYIGKQVGQLYFMLSSLVIIVYLTILQQDFSMLLTALVIANGILAATSTFIINYLGVSKIFKAVLSVIIMLLLEQLFCGYVSSTNAHNMNGDILSVVSASIVLMAVHYFDRYLTQRENTINDLIKQANNDELTGLFNLYRLQQNFNSELFKQTTFALVIMDLDHFKAINDNHGHGFGNNVLITFSKKVTWFLETKVGSDFFELYRYGGEEFVILIKKQIPERILINIFDDLQACIHQVDIPGLNQNLSFSAGIAYLEPHAYDPLRTFESADQLLYRAKKSGKKHIRSEKNTSKSQVSSAQ